MIKKIIIVAVWVILISGLGVYTVFTEKQHSVISCNNLDILIKYNSSDYFLIEDDILEHFLAKGIKIKGEPIASISTGDIESALYSIPYVEKAQVHTTIEGDVKVRITQKKPLIKVYNKFSQSYYIDQNGGLLPVSDKYTARLPVANGEIADYYTPSVKLKQEDSLNPDTSVTKSALYKLYVMALFIDRDPFWKAMIEEIYINEKQELELYTKIGDAVVIFGDISDMKEKFDKLFVFYKEGLKKIGWNKYGIINLKYKNQVVCTKT